MDFIRSARISRGDLPIVLLPSRAGKRSRIEARVDGPVSTPRSDASIIVAEYGVADLRTLTVSQRVDALLRIAPPDARHELARSAGLGVGYRIGSGPAKRLDERSTIRHSLVTSLFTHAIFNSLPIDGSHIWTGPVAASTAPK